MQITPIDISEIPRTSTRSANSPSAKLVTEFLDSSADVAIVDLEDEEKSPASVRSTLANYIERARVPVKVFSRGGKLLLQRTDTAPVA